MTSSHQFPHQNRAGWERAYSVGAWFFMPDRRNPSGDVRPGYLSRNGERVILQYCSGALTGLLHTLYQLDSDLATRWGALFSQAEA